MFKSNKQKRESLETDCARGTLCKKIIESVTLKRFKFHCLQGKNSLFRTQSEILLVWGKVSSFPFL